MTRGTASVIVAVPDPLNVAASGGRALVPAVPAARRRALARAWSITRDGVGILAVVYAVPLAVLVVGIPVALAVRLLLWLAGGA